MTEKFSRYIMSRLVYLDKSQRDLADLLGVNPGTITTKYATPERWRFHEIIKLASFLDVTMEELARRYGE